MRIDLHVRLLLLFSQIERASTAVFVAGGLALQGFVKAEKLADLGWAHGGS